MVFRIFSEVKLPAPSAMKHRIFTSGFNQFTSQQNILFILIKNHKSNNIIRLINSLDITERENVFKKSVLTIIFQYRNNFNGV